MRKMETMTSKQYREQEKEKIRQRYKGVDTDLIEVIPADKEEDFYDEDIRRRVAVYVRVSTDNLQQTSSYELQKNHYEDYVAKHPLWTLVGLYSDEGISGTSLKHRDSFNKMIEDCKQGKIDIIITKSVSRFARNIVDCISIVRELLALPNPVGVYFEMEGIFTPKDNAEMQLSFIATLAQEESHNKSQSMIRSLEMRFSHGIVLTPVLLGYDHDENKELIVNNSEARIVRLIFYMYLFGNTCKEIAEALTELGCKTKIGNTVWSEGSVNQILRNERYCGDVLTWKTYTHSYIDHKSKKNRRNRPQHRLTDHHEAIITRDDFIAVQHLLNNAKYGNKGILPELQVVKEGALKGFVSVNPRWFGFKASDYIEISETVQGNDAYEEGNEYTANSGDFDLRGFEVARSQFFDTANRMCVTFSNKTIKFSSTCIKKFNNMQYIELLVHPQKKLLAVRVSGKAVRNSLRWASMNSSASISPRIIAGAAFIPTLYELFGWDIDYKYRIRGTRQSQGDKSVLIFNVSETELFIPQDNVEMDTSNPDITPIAPKSGKSIVAFPKDWVSSFGNSFYKQSNDVAVSIMSMGCITAEAVPIDSDPEGNRTTPEMIATNIKRLMNDIKQEDNTNGYDSTNNE